MTENKWAGDVVQQAEKATALHAENAATDRVPIEPTGVTLFIYYFGCWVKPDSAQW